jgi:hypothetical protein
MKTKTVLLVTALTLISILMSACGGSDADATPTMAPEEIQTMAVATFADLLTQTALANPTETPTPTSTVTPFATITLSANTTPIGTIAVGNPTSSCYSMAFVSDVSIPDNTAMTPGETFTKTWKVSNNGSCAWDAGFQFALTGGEAMGSATLTLTQSVAPGATADLSVNMTAPSTNGTFRGNWRMSTAAGQFFGDEVYLIIVVGGAGAAPEVPTATATP